MATLTKQGITEAVVAAAGGFSKREASEIVEAFFEVIKESLERGDTVKVAGFGNFVVRDKKSRVGRNPQTGEAIEISARRVVTFKASDLLKRKLADAVGDGD
jgi:integration host factor subunit alpha